MESGNVYRYHIALVHEPLRQRTFWVLSDNVVPEGLVDRMLPGIIDASDMFVATPPLMFVRTPLPVFGRISKNAAFLRPGDVADMPSVLVTNSQFWQCIPNDTDFYNQLVEVGQIFAEDFQQAVVELERDFNLHLIAV